MHLVENNSFAGIVRAYKISREYPRFEYLVGMRLELQYTPQTPTGAGDLTITGALATAGVADLGAVTAPTIYAVSDESGKNFTFYGTDYYDMAITSAALAGPTAGATVTSLTSFKTITRIAVSAATTGAVEAGVAGTGISRAIPMDIHQSAFNVALVLDVTGTIDCTVQHTHADPFSATFNNYTATWLNHDTMAAKTADDDDNYAFPVRAIRLKVNSSSSGTASLSIIQTGMGYRYWVLFPLAVPMSPLRLAT